MNIYIWMDPLFPLIVRIVNGKCAVNVNKFDIFRSFRLVLFIVRIICGPLDTTRNPYIHRIAWKVNSGTCYSLVRSSQSIHVYRIYQMYYMLQLNIPFGVETSFLTISLFFHHSKDLHWAILFILYRIFFLNFNFVQLPEGCLKIEDE